MIIGPSVASFLILLFFFLSLFFFKAITFCWRASLNNQDPHTWHSCARLSLSLFSFLSSSSRRFFSLTCACALYLVIYHSRLFLLLYSSRTWNYIFFFFAPRKEIFSDLFIFRKLFSSFPPICLKFFLFERKKTLTSSSFFFLSPSFFTSMYGEIKKPVAIFLL